jgi:hypothetical protein
VPAPAGTSVAPLARPGPGPGFIGRVRATQWKASPFESPNPGPALACRCSKGRVRLARSLSFDVHRYILVKG